MKKQSLFEKVIYMVIGAVFFVAYYFLMTEYFKINPFAGWFIGLSIYFGLAVITFPISGKVLSEKIDVIGINSKIIMPIAYIFAPIISVFALRENK